MSDLSVPMMKAELTGCSELEALKSGDEQAWEQAFRRLWPVAFRAAQHPELRLTPHEAEEAASEALASLVGRVGQIPALEDLTPLAATIAYRRAVSVARNKFAAKRQPAAGFAGAGEAGDFDEAAPAGAEPGLNEVELRELTVLLRGAVADLDPSTYALVYGKIGLCMSYEELSARHQMPLGTVCAKVARGLKKVRQHLQQNPALMKELHNHLR